MKFIVYNLQIVDFCILHVNYRVNSTKISFLRGIEFHFNRDLSLNFKSKRELKLILSISDKGLASIQSNLAY